MKNAWLVWIFIVGVIVTVFFAFNYQSQKQAIPLSEIFPEEESHPVDIEYEFVDSNEKGTLPAVVNVPSTPVNAPVPTAIVSTSVAVKVEEPVHVKPAIASSIPVVASSTLQDVAYTIQIASFKEKARAEKVYENLTNKKFNPYVVSRNLGEKGIWYRVYVGKFSSKAEANILLIDIQKIYPSSFIIAPRKMPES